MSPGRQATALMLVAALVTAACAVGGRALGRDRAGGRARDAVTEAAAPETMRERRFPHAAHAGLFPTCVGCHEGVVSGTQATRFPAPASCVGCHDGGQVARVQWEGPAPAASNLRFSHVEHAREVVADSQRLGGAKGDPALQCGACHRLQGDVRFLAVARARPAACLDCHAHEAPAHLDERADCGTCHVPLARAAALSVERIAKFPRPPSHDAPDFLRRHAPENDRALASCATCHAQESCARCHVDARTQRSIAALPADARVARLVAGRAGRWPLPPSHERRDWVYEHGEDATSAPASCATCHAQPSCRTCHIGAGAAREIRRLPAPDPGASPGVQLHGVRASAAALRDERSWLAVRAGSHAPPGTPRDQDAASAGERRHRPVPLGIEAAQGDATAGTGLEGDSTRRRVVRVHAATYARDHGTEASARQLDCTGCHTQRFCSDCHAGEGRRRFHPANFVQRHAPEAWGREQDCASCHNPEAFCRSCHTSAGLASQGGLSSAYHTRQPGWLLQHGQAARQGLESCTTCHTQSDCMQCHSRAGWNVNPHGRDFDAERMARRSPGTCTACHVGDPLARRR